MNPSRFSEKEIVELFSVTRQRLGYWRKIGLLPRHEPGSARGYSYRDLLSIKVILNLLTAKIQVRRIKQALDDLKKYEPSLKNPLTEKSFFVRGKKIVIMHNNKAFDIASKQFLLFHLKDLDKDLKSNPLISERLGSADQEIAV
ncbi:MAG: MerR family transcriptional regulator [Desulfovibrionaceae bacterium]